MLPGLVKLKL